MHADSETHAASNGSKHSSSTDRDHRTVLTLASVVGRDIAELALTHFVGSRVAVAIVADLLQSPSGWTAATLALNILTRFIGDVELRVFGELDTDLSRRLSEKIERYQRIDSRPGHSVSWNPGVSDLDAAVVLCIGSEAAAIGRRFSLAEDGSRTAWVVALGFTGWTCHVAHLPSTEMPVVKPSSVVFGACAGACFATAEVFKLLLLSCVGADRIASFERRLTKNWHYDIWHQERCIPEESSEGPDPLPEILFQRVVQVGAGAVGNATAFTFVETSSITGVLPIIDFKKVDSKNLNRCLYFSENEVNAQKVDVVAQASRTDFEILGINEPYSPAKGEKAEILLSTVDNNAVRHQMQESLPKYVVEGSTGETRLSVSIHTAIDGRMCLVCKHPDRSLGLERTIPLTITDAVKRTGLPESIIRTGIADGSTEISDSVIETVRQHSNEVAKFLEEARDEGKDLCGALGDLRDQFGLRDGPREASIPFVSVLAGVISAAEVAKLVMRASGIPHVPVLDNVVEFDLARDYSRRTHVSGSYPAHTDCQFCMARSDEVRDIYSAKHGLQ